MVPIEAIVFVNVSTIAETKRVAKIYVTQHRFTSVSVEIAKV